MATAKKISHPFFVRGLFDIIERLPFEIPSGSLYGQIYFSSSIAFNDEVTGHERNLKMKLSGYGSIATGLCADNTYLLSGRFMILERRSTGVLYYDTDLNMLIGESEKFTTSLANKVACWGFGNVVTRNEVHELNSTSATLLVTLRHSDYDNVSRNSVEFEVRYRIPGHKNLAKTFGLFQLGREILITGYISGFDQKARLWVVTALNVALASGHRSNEGTNSMAGPSGPSGIRRRPGFIELDDDDETPTSETPSAGKGKERAVENSGSTSVPEQNQPTNSLSSREELREDGEVVENAAPQGFPDTFPKKRTQKDVLNDARKRMK